MRHSQWIFFVAVALLAPQPSLAIGPAQDSAYFPLRGDWERAAPAEMGLNPGGVAAAVLFAIENEASTATDLREYISSTLANEPHGAIVGPVRDRGEMTGIVVRGGRIVAEWGTPERVDMTFSVTKTYLSSVVGIAHDRKLIPNVHAPVSELVPTWHFEGEHNGAISWDHLLRQTSDWRGTLFTKPDWADRPPRSIPLAELPSQPEREPGATWKYNDVRVNLLAFAALQVWREPLPVVLRRELMDPIGCSASWRWHGYETSWVELDGLRIQSVSGGGHWGGGMWINSFDQARFGYLFLREGVWGERRIISQEWIAMARTPTKPNQGYGYMNWFLNSAQRPALPSAPKSAVTFRGAGANIVYVDWENDLLAVVRWINSRAMDGFVKRLIAAIE